MLLRKRNDDFDCVKTFDLISYLIIAVSNIFKQSNMQMGIVSLEYLILLLKVLFFERGYLYSDFVCARRTRHFEMK